MKRLVDILGTAIAVMAFVLFSAAPNVHAQIVQLGNKLIGTTPSGTSEQGTSVAVSADGNTMVVGGAEDNGYAGAVWVYSRNGNVWSQQGNKLAGSPGLVNVYQGQSVALSADGNTMVVGGPGDNSNIGAAWVFTRSGGVWTQQGGKLVGTGYVGSPRQGQSVAMSADGNTTIIGGWGDNSGIGAAWVFTRTGNIWTQQGSKLVGTGNVGQSYQGQSVAMSGDGNTAIIGGHTDNSNIGAAWVFTRSGGVWSQQGNKLIGTGYVGTPRQGFSVAMSADGNTTILGGYSDNSFIGAAWVFTRSGNIWTQQGSKLVGGSYAGTPNQGTSVAMSTDGNTAIVGGWSDNSNIGAAWVFTRSGGVWSQQGNKLVGTGYSGVSDQGYSVAVSADGNTVIAGGLGDNGGIGAAWVFVQPATPSFVSVCDVPNDQGGKVSLRWTASVIDQVPGNLIDSYWIWRQVPTSYAMQQLANGARLIKDRVAMGTPMERTIRASVTDNQIYYWEYVGSQVSHGFPGYSYTAATLFDSVAASNPYTLFMVEAEQLSTGLYWSSLPDSGYSVDNLAPAAPGQFAAVCTGDATALHWTKNAEADFSVYALYRGGTANFVPDSASFVATLSDTGYVDHAAINAYYKLAALDIHGNPSPYVLARANLVTSVPPPVLTFALEPVRPNPSVGHQLNVQFTLPSAAPGAINLVDVTGRLIFRQDITALGAGSHTVDLSEKPLASGLYFIRLNQGPRAKTIRVMVIR